MSADARGVIGRAVRLPTIDEPGLDFEMLSRENLHAYAIEEPRRVRRDVRGLIGPIVEVVIAEQAYVGHEDSRIHVDPMQDIEVVSAVRFGYVAISISKLPLSIRKKYKIDHRVAASRLDAIS